MQWRNSANSWGWVSIVLHWLSTVVIIGLFLLGLWMVDLTYYDAWYRTSTDIHRSVGVLILLLTLARIIWKKFQAVPSALPKHKPWEHLSAVIAHSTMYLLLIAITISGYLISTADGRSLHVFNWFSIPATLHGIEHQEDIAGNIHFILAVALIALTVIHAAGALKHHFVDRDTTLKRMLIPNSPTTKG